jgi:cytochrome c oxidase cbb3-type subunit 3
MADFVNNFWPWYIAVLVTVSILACFALVRWMSERRPEGGTPETMGHVWDEDLAEFNNPLPGWWLKMFYITLFFAIGYLALYPGLGIFSGFLGWTQVGQYEAEVDRVNAAVGPMYAKYAQTDLAALASDEDAMKTGARLFATYCTQCHGSDARGATGFPNLRDNDWLYGGDPQTIKTTIMKGRTGAMPAWKAVLGEEGVKNVTQYVISLSGREADPAAVAAGKEKFMQLCVACHGVDGKGNHALGAPNLTDNIWLYGGSPRAIAKTISDGRNGRMPAHEEFLGDNKVHLLAAYVYSLSALGK